MSRWLSWWPLMWKSSHEAVRRENYTLRDALREANHELRRHRQLIGGIRSGSIDLVRSLERAIMYFANHTGIVVLRS